MLWESCASMRNTMIQGAKEELEILEFLHPDKFHSMKVELKAFISELESQDLPLKTSSICPCPSAATQESSSRKKRKKTCTVVAEADLVEEPSNLKVGSYGGIKRRCKTDAVLERAQQCLHKIQHLKTSFFY